MDSTDEEFYGSTSFTTKGRRTKRQRTATTTTTTSAYGGGSGGAYPENSYGSSASATPSQSTPNDQDAVSEVTTEEQDLANCLILLAQGLQKGRTSKIIMSTNHINKNTSNNSTNSSVVAGVYECKTCNRTFPSFQALGGHRTSHKKTVKPTITPPPPPPPPKPEEQPRDGGSHDSSPVPPPRKPVPTRPNLTSTATRVHECSICGSEFPSGQALGGHMRRHRTSVAPHDRPVITTGEVTSMSITEIIEIGGPRNNNILALDLNLPAPSDDHDDDVGNDDDDHDRDNNSSHMVETTTKFHVLPTPALLDCHY